MDDRNRLTHMLWAAQEACGFAQGKAIADLRADRLLLRGLVHCIQEIGEAAAKVGEESRARAPELPWNQIVGMRHRVVHVYYDIDVRAVWEVVSVDLPVMVGVLERALKEWKGQEG